MKPSELVKRFGVKGLKVIPAEWLKRYLEKSKADMFFVDNVLVCEKGFATWIEMPEQIMIVDCYGDGMFWKKFFIQYGKAKNKKRVVFATRRNPEAFKRRFGVEIVSYDEESKSWLLVYPLVKKKELSPSELLKRKKATSKRKQLTNSEIRSAFEKIEKMNNLVKEVK